MSRHSVPLTDEALKNLRELAEASTKVVAWYPHGPGDGYHLGKGSVRGPFGRWFLVEGGDNGMGDPVKYPVPVAPLEDDAKFAAAAMNNLVPLLDLVEALNQHIAVLKSEWNQQARHSNSELLKLDAEVRRLRGST